MKHLFLFGFVALLALAPAAFALDLSSAKQQGMVGEKRDGYLGVVSGGPEAQQLVDSVNAKRKEEYARTAADSGQPLATVEKLGAQQAIGKTASGNYVQDAGGAWVKK